MKSALSVSYKISAIKTEKDNDTSCTNTTPTMTSKNQNYTQIQYNGLNSLVFVQKSKIRNAGNGLFAKQGFCKGDLICTYGGHLVDIADAKYIHPMYIVNFENGRGFKLVGDNQDGDCGHYANAVHPADPSITQNAKFCINDDKVYLPNQRGRFNIYAVKDIAINEEIIVNYGEGYWLTIQKWEQAPPIKSEASKAREERASKRARLFEKSFE